ncbi:MAG TPA: hypothetical protein VFO89_17505, partial [Thermoanaerobaculia bacterium]|nr:hypothetical protein [Thermoanaerobaculia bacterium]
MTTETAMRIPAAGRATIPILDARGVERLSEQVLRQARALLARIESVPLDAVSTEAVLDVWDDASVAMEDAFGPISLLNSVHPDKSVRDACDVALVRESSFLTDVYQNEAFYQRVQRLVPTTIAARELRKHLLESFED